MTYEKKCSCGIVWTKLPDDLKEWIDDELKLVGKTHIIGYFFNCVCHSTLFITYNNYQRTFKKTGDL